MQSTALCVYFVCISSKNQSMALLDLMQSDEQSGGKMMSPPSEMLLSPRLVVLERDRYGHVLQQPQLGGAVLIFGTSCVIFSLISTEEKCLIPDFSTQQ